MPCDLRQSASMQMWSTLKSRPGVVDAFSGCEGNDNVGELLDGVAIVARSTWQAFQAKQELEGDVGYL